MSDLFVNLVPAEGHFLFSKGYNDKENSSALLNQMVHKSWGTCTENVCHSSLLHAHVVPGEDRIRGRHVIECLLFLMFK